MSSESRTTAVEGVAIPSERSDDEAQASRRGLLALFGALGAVTLTACGSESGSVQPEKLRQTASALTGTATWWVDTMASLRAYTAAPNQVVVLLGYWSTGDGGGGIFVYDAGTVYEDHGTQLVVGAGSSPALGTAGPGWRRIYDGALSVRWFGAKGNQVDDDSAAISAAISGGSSNGLTFPFGNYRIATSITLPAHRPVTFLPGAALVIDSSVVVTFAATITADPASRLFTGQGTASLNIGSQPHVWADWFGSLQAAVNVAGAAKTTIRLRATTYTLASPLIITSDDVVIIGTDSQGETVPITCPPSTATTDVGSTIVFSGGANAAIQVGHLGQVEPCGTDVLRTFRVQLRNFRLHLPTVAACGILTWGLTNSVIENVSIRGNAGNGNFGLRMQGNVDVDLVRLEVTGCPPGVTSDGGVKGVSIEYAILSASPPNSSPSTTTRLVSCYLHYCYMALSVDTSCVTVHHSILESSWMAFYAVNGSELDLEDCWIENCGWPAASNVAAGYLATGTYVKMRGGSINMYALQNFFTVAGAARLVLDGVRLASSAPSPRLLDPPSFSYPAADHPELGGHVHLRGCQVPPNFSAGASYANSGAVVDDAKVVIYRWRAATIGSTTSISPVPCENGTAAGRFYMPVAGYLLAVNAYYDRDITAGAYDAAILVKDVNVLALPSTNARWSQSMAAFYEKRLHAGDYLTAYLHSAALSPASGDLIIEAVVALGDAGE